MKKIYILVNVIAFIWMSGGVVWAQQTWSGIITDENGLNRPHCLLPKPITNRWPTPLPLERGDIQYQKDRILQKERLP